MDALRILAVEDNPADFRLLREYLSEAPATSFEVVGAPTMREALELLSAGGFAAVLLDLGLPDCTGLAGLDRIAASAPTLPVIVLTGLQDSATGLLALSKNAQDYLVKGKIDGDALARSIRYAIARKRAEEESRASQEKLALAVSGTGIGIFHQSIVTGEILATEQQVRLLGLRPILAPTTPPTTTLSQRYGYRDWAERVHPEDLPRVEAEMARCMAECAPVEAEYRVVWLDGSVHWLVVRGVFQYAADGRPQHLLGIAMDNTVRKQAEVQIKAALAEKDVLLKEIHHRVKNNLQVISSMVSLQADTLSEPTERGPFRDVRDRVRAMALVHEKLYQSGNLAEVAFADYAANLLQHLWRAHGEAVAAVDLKLALEPVALSVERAVPCGLILNELASNALKHAFPGRQKGEVTVALSRTAAGAVRLRVSDNGAGLPAGLDWRQARTLGLRLVQMLAAQLGGTVKARQPDGGGTEFELAWAGKEH
ncbi:MAG: hypothetical protein A3K19_30135 [Lentisphaerae bacterium RIFOXYB12_FULL_65_16]|nr:MAG: hypothetical protein A3K18_18870 [Lentisphaerae bacterium RIFOXYA12_64_32]OGV85759.1 MAG: hypothetical protein A3K19_30135 [Lentisphaerae bacterium RIFOXYB12_FULL_65_16]